MILEYLVGFVGCLIITAYFYFTWNNKFFEKHGIPYEKPLFFYGNYKESMLEKKHLGVLMKDLYDKFQNAAYIGFYRFNTPTLMLRDPELIKNVMVKDFSSFANNNVQTLAENDPLFHYNAFAQLDDAWKTTRAHMSPCLTTNKIKMMFCHMEEKNKNLVTHLKELCQAKKAEDIDAKDLSATYTTDVIATSVFGVDSNSFKDPNSMYRQITKSIILPSFWSGISIVMIMIFPIMQKIIRYRFTSPAIEKLILKISKDTIEYREKHNIVKNDFFQQMINLRQKNGDKVFSDAYIACQAFGFLVDGYDTSSTVLAYTLFEIGKNMDVQSKLREEIKGIYEANNNSLPYDEVINAKYLEMVISEVLRMHPPGLALEKVCTKDFEFPPAITGGKPFLVKRDTIISIPLWAIQMDPKYYENPEIFNPENFTNEAIMSRPKCSYFPFGEGPRICYGSRLGLTQVKSAVCSILLHFEMRTSAKCLKSGYTIDPAGLLKQPLGGLKINFYNLEM